MIRVWLGLHQLDLVMRHVFKLALDDEFLAILTRLTDHLLPQQNLISEIACTCPIVADTRWLSMPSVTSWLTLKRMGFMIY